MTRRPIEADVKTGREGRDEDEPTPGVDADVFREALSEWAATVTVVAARDAGDVHGVTVTSFFPVSAEPPQIAVSLGPNARILPFLDEGTPFAVSLLADGQRGISSRFADAYPVGPSPFAAEGPPVVDSAVVALVCSVRSITPVEGGARLVVGLVERVVEGSGETPLLYHRRGYRRLEDD